jgi:hypothetical protein
MLKSLLVICLLVVPVLAETIPGVNPDEDIGYGYWGNVVYPPDWPRWRGDANKSGTVNFPDYLILEANWGRRHTYSPLWSQGNFYSPRIFAPVNFMDYMIMEDHWGWNPSTVGGDNVACSFSTSPWLTWPYDFSEMPQAWQYAAQGTLTPEPCTLALLVCGALCLSWRRR